MVVVRLVVLVPIVSARAVHISWSTACITGTEGSSTDEEIGLPSMHTIEIAWLAWPIFVVPPVRLVDIDSTVEDLLIRTHPLGRFALEHQVSLHRERKKPQTNAADFSLMGTRLVKELSNQSGPLAAIMTQVCVYNRLCGRPECSDMHTHLIVFSHFVWQGQCLPLLLLLLQNLLTF